MSSRQKWFKTTMRSGLRIRGARGHPEVRGALIRYAKWLRKNYEFPMRCPVYLFPTETIITQDGEEVSASFFAPWDRSVEPFIRIATGDYPDLERTEERDNAMAAFIVSLSHEVVHYFQWIKSNHVHERGVERKAVAMLDRYALEVDHP